MSINQTNIAAASGQPRGRAVGLRERAPAAALVVESYTPLRDLAQSGQISHRIVPAGPDLRIWPAEPDLTDLAGWARCCVRSGPAGQISGPARSGPASQISHRIWPSQPDPEIWPCQPDPV
jgi:hypothetical protein